MFEEVSHLINFANPHYLEINYYCWGLKSLLQQSLFQHSYILDIPRKRSLFIVSRSNKYSFKGSEIIKSITQNDDPVNSEKSLYGRIPNCGSDVGIHRQNFIQFQTWSRKLSLWFSNIVLHKIFLSNRSFIYVNSLCSILKGKLEAY